MIPILYESNEIYFDTNGLGRLRDCISCIVTEERNGIYECDFEYPVAGAHFDEIRYGRIVAVEHDYTNDMQPFDIVSATKPINGVVKFHAVHISYRQSKMVTYGTGVQSLADAFDMFDTVFFPENPMGTDTGGNPFTYLTDKDSTGYVAAFDGEPRSIRSILGGVEGSILDSYGGEYEWDKFFVYLRSARGSYKDFAIRYSVNLLDYTEDVDYSETYSSIIPYWKGTDENQNPIYVIGDQTNYSTPTVTGRGETVPIDLTDKFETQPTKAQVEAAGADYLNAQQPVLPQRNISIDFVRLQDTDEYAELAGLFNCKLCDTIRVIFPTYKMDGYYKIVKIVYNVLTERYDSVELGALPTTLSQALGLSK